MPQNDDSTPPPYDTHQPKNIVLFGETGAGKSSVINLIAGDEIASTSPNAEPCTLDATQYALTLPGEYDSCPGMLLHVFDTVGLEEPDEGPTSLLGAIQNAHALITTLRSSGGIHLLLFCVRAGRITTQMQRQYRLFSEVMCGEQVPLAIVVTHLENEPVMENWWVQNSAAFEKYGIHSVAHACVTAAPSRLRVFAPQRAASRVSLQCMLRQTLSNPRPAYVQDTENWFLRVLDMCLEYLLGGLRGSFKRKALMSKLEARCLLPRDLAQKVAAMLTRRG